MPKGTRKKTPQKYEEWNDKDQSRKKWNRD